MQTQRFGWQYINTEKALAKLGIKVKLALLQLAKFILQQSNFVSAETCTSDWGRPWETLNTHSSHLFNDTDLFKGSVYSSFPIFVMESTTGEGLALPV